MSAGTADIELRMKSDPNLLSGARELVLNVSKRLNFSEERSGQIALAVDEALANVIRHGYGRASGRPIWLFIWTSLEDGGEGIRIVVEDEAKQVAPESIKSRDLDEIRPGGLGVHIIRQVMDEVVYEHREPTGMRLRMTKRLQESAEEQREQEQGAV